MVSAWRRSLYAAVVALVAGTAAGSLASDGRVTDGDTGAPIAGAVITANGESAETDASGDFRHAATGTLGVRAVGYRARKVDARDFAGGPVRLTPVRPRALYLTVQGIGAPALREGALRLIRAGAANALVIDAKGDRGIVGYPSRLNLAPGARALTTIPDLPGLLSALRAEGIYTIARIVVFKDAPLATLHPEWAVKAGAGLYRDGEGSAWTDPFRRAVWTYNIEIAKEAAAAGFEEIQFDYVRFPDSRGELRFAQPSTEVARIAAIAGFLREARRQLLPSNVYTSADIFGYACWNTTDTGIGQGLAEIAAAVDYISPMLYPSGFHAGIPGFPDPVANPYQIVRLSLERARERLAIPSKRFRPWLQAFQDYAFDRRTFDAVMVNEQIRAASDFGANGWMLWNARNRYEGLGAVAVAQSGTRACL